MIFDMNAMPLLRQFQEASDAEGVAIRALLAYLQSGGRDHQRLEELTDSMTAAHDKKMGILDQLQPFRVDK
jgi:hypothetical protein